MSISKTVRNFRFGLGRGYGQHRQLIYNSNNPTNPTFPFTKAWGVWIAFRMVGNASANGNKVCSLLLGSGKTIDLLINADNTGSIVDNNTNNTYKSSDPVVDPGSLAVQVDGWTNYVYIGSTGLSGMTDPVTYDIATTYVNTAGETTLSPVGVVTVPADTWVTVLTPPSEANVNSWNCYIKINGVWYKQNSTPIAIGTNFTFQQAIQTSTNTGGIFTLPNAEVLGYMWIEDTSFPFNPPYIMQPYWFGFTLVNTHYSPYIESSFISNIYSPNPRILYALFPIIGLALFQANGNTGIGETPTPQEFNADSFNIYISTQNTNSNTPPPLNTFYLVNSQPIPIGSHTNNLIDSPPTSGPNPPSVSGTLPIAPTTNTAAQEYPQTPTAPTLGQVSGGTSVATTYYFGITYYNNAGETLLSTVQSVAVAADYVPTVTNAANDPNSMNSSGMNIYGGLTSTTLTKQASVALTYGTNFEANQSTWTMPTSGLVAGASPPTTNTAEQLIPQAPASSPTFSFVGNGQLSVGFYKDLQVGDASTFNGFSNVQLPTNGDYSLVDITPGDYATDCYIMLINNEVASTNSVAPTSSNVTPPPSVIVPPNPWQPPPPPASTPPPPTPVACPALFSAGGYLNCNGGSVVYSGHTYPVSTVGNYFKPYSEGSYDVWEGQAPTYNTYGYAYCDGLYLKCSGNGWSLWTPQALLVITLSIAGVGNREFVVTSQSPPILNFKDNGEVSGTFSGSGYYGGGTKPTGEYTIGFQWSQSHN